MWKNPIDTYLEDLVKEELKEQFPDITEDEIRSAYLKAAYIVRSDEDLWEEINNKIRSACREAFYELVEPMRHTQFNVPNDGDVLVEYDHNSIHLYCNYPNNGEISVVYGDNEFPAYFAYISELDWKNEVVNKLHEIIENLSPDDTIIYPFVQIWHKDLNDWHKEGFSDDDLERLEKILESYFEDIETDDDEVEICNEAFKEKESLYSFRRKWPNRVKEIISFIGERTGDSELSGKLTVSLYSDEEISIFIEATIREKLWSFNGSRPKYWDVHHWQAIDRSFPLFSESDNQKIEAYLLEKFPLEEEQSV